MKKIEIILYTIDELKSVNEKAYKKVLDNAREILIDNNFNYASDDIIVTLKDRYNLDVNNKEIFYSISYCQGDGFCFIYDNLLSYYNIKNKNNCNVFEKWIIDNLTNDEMTLLLDYLNSGYNLKIEKTSHYYCHAYTCTIDYETFYSSDDYKYIDKINDFIYDLTQKLYNNVYLKICSEIETMLYSYYDIDDNDIIDFINDNEYLYSIDGVLY